MTMKSLPFPTSGDDLTNAMFAKSSPSSDLSREELDRLRNSLQTDSMNFEFPRLFPDRTTSQPSHLAFRCVKIVKKSPRTSLIPQDDWLKLIARGESDITQPLIDRDSTVPKPDVDMKAYHEKEDSPSANDRSSCPVANLESPSTSKEPADEDKEEGHAPPPDLSPLQ